MFNDLIQNSSLLIALSVLYGILTRTCKSDTFSCKIIGGILFGTITLAAMKMSIQYNTGVIYDGRSIVLTLSGFVWRGNYRNHFRPNCSSIPYLPGGCRCLGRNGNYFYFGIGRICLSPVTPQQT